MNGSMPMARMVSNAPDDASMLLEMESQPSQWDLAVDGSILACLPLVFPQ